MSSFGPGVAQSVAGTQQMAQTSLRETRKREPAKLNPKRIQNGDIVEVDQVEAAEAVRSLKDNGQEEAHEDRQERPRYEPWPAADQPPRLDLEA